MIKDLLRKLNRQKKIDKGNISWHFRVSWSIEYLFCFKKNYINEKFLIFIIIILQKVYISDFLFILWAVDLINAVSKTSSIYLNDFW